MTEARPVDRVSALDQRTVQHGLVGDDTPVEGRRGSEQAQSHRDSKRRATAARTISGVSDSRQNVGWVQVGWKKHWHVCSG